MRGGLTKHPQGGALCTDDRSCFSHLACCSSFPIGTSAFPAANPEEVGLSRERLARIGQALTSQIDARSFPGAVAFVARKGSIAYFEAFGQLDPQSGAPMAKDAIFRLYSMTKPFTSVAAMMLVEDGRLRLMDPVGVYLPQLAKLEVAMPSTDASGKPTYTLVAAERPVTIYDLLRHTSGIVYAQFTRTEYIKESLHEGQGGMGRRHARRANRSARQGTPGSSARDDVGIWSVD